MRNTTGQRQKQTGEKAKLKNTERQRKTKSQRTTESVKPSKQKKYQPAVSQCIPNSQGK